MYASSKTSKTVSRKFLKFEIFFSVSSGEDLSGGRRSQKGGRGKIFSIYIYIPRPYTSLFFVYINLNLSDRELSSSFVYKINARK